VSPSGSKELVTTEAPDEQAEADSLGEIVAPIAITVDSTDTVREVAEQMTANDIGLVVVAGEGRLKGVVSERDLVRAIAEDIDPDDERAADIMSVDVVSAGTSTSISDAADMMIEGGVRHLPVVDEDHVIGVVSMRDLIPLTRQA